MAPPIVFYPNLNFIAFNGLHPPVFSHTAGIFSVLQLFAHHSYPSTSPGELTQ